MRRPLIAFALSILAFSACDDFVPTEPARRSLTVNTTELQYRRPFEKPFLAIDSAIGGFGGMYFNEKAELVVVVTDPSRTTRLVNAARAALKGRTSSRREQPTVITRMGKYSFTELAVWRDRVVMPVLDLPGAVSVDLDEHENRIVAGFESQTQALAAREVVSELGVPEDAFDVVVESPIVSAVGYISRSEVRAMASSAANDSVQNEVRPVVAGTQVMLSRAAPGTGELPVCTLGLIVDLDQANNRYAVTNSHCSVSLFAQDTTVYWQPGNALYAPTAGLFFENEDVGWFWCGFFPLRHCRYSDSNIMRVQTGWVDSLVFAKIAKTMWYGMPGDTGSRGIDQQNPYFEIASWIGGGPIEGDSVDKVGRTSGWTRGVVLDTCEDINVTHAIFGTYRLLCQHETNMRVDGGDSGAPTFLVDYDIYVLFWGIVTGHTDTGLSYHSPLDNLQTDFGYTYYPQ